ncbi:MAG: hypothetical protein FVQ85_05075 [Planctomycetes bacterium]|nr:hypothetical protein [Planctomycetota bacterium]
MSDKSLLILVLLLTVFAGGLYAVDGAIVVPYITGREKLQRFSPHPGWVAVFEQGESTGIYATIDSAGNFTLADVPRLPSLIAGFHKMETAPLILSQWKPAPDGLSNRDLAAMEHYDYVCLPPGYPDLWDRKYMVRAHTFYQTFIAKSRWLYSVTLYDGPKIVWWGNKPSVRICEGTIGGPPIKMRRHDEYEEAQTSLHTDHAFPRVGFRHGDIELEPGKKYTVVVKGYESHGGEHFDLDLFVRPDKGHGYGPGSAYADRVPQGGDLCMLIMGNATGQIVENQMRTPEWEIFIPKRKPARSWGQAFIAHGVSMAGVEFWGSDGAKTPVKCRLTIREDGPNGRQIGPAKTAISQDSPEQPVIRYPQIPGQMPGFDAYYEYPFDRFAAAWTADEVPLTPGKPYYVDCSFSEPVLLFADGDYYHDGYAYYKGRRVDKDKLFHSPRWTLLMAIVTYENDGGAPTEYPEPALARSDGDNLILNGGAEQGDFFGWTIGGDPTIDPSTHIPDPPNHSGQHRFGMSVGWGKADFYQYQKIKVKLNATYEVGMWAAKADGTDETLEMSWIDGAFGGKENRLYTAGPQEKFDKWRQFAGARFTPKAAQITLIIRYRHTSPTNIASIHVDDITLKIRE